MLKSNCLVPMFMFVGLLFSGVGQAQFVSSSHAGPYAVIEQAADTVNCTADDLTDAVKCHFRGSGLYRELLRNSRRIGSDSARLSRMARRCDSYCDIRNQALEAAECLRNFQLLVAEARYRSEVGIDCPLAGCTLHVDSSIGRAAQALSTVLAITSPAQVVVVDPYRGNGGFRPQPWQATRPDYYGGANPPGYDPQSNPVPGFVPGELPSETLPAPRSQFEEIDPPLTYGRPPVGNPTRGQWTGRATERAPLGMFGPGGNGIEMNNGGVVLRIGGNAIQLR